MCKQVTAKCIDCKKERKVSLKTFRRIEKGFSSGRCSNCSLTIARTKIVNRKHSEDAKRKMSLAAQGRKLSDKEKQRLRSLQLGKKQTAETIQKRVEKLRGKKRTKEVRELMSLLKKGKPVPWATGENHYLYKKDRSTLKKSDRRNDSAYKDWRLKVYKRDKYKCQIDNADCFGRLEVHHILPWIDYPELRYEIKNGICLCKNHHPRKKEDVQSFAKFYQEIINNKQYEPR
jgi:hypothetical protein